MENNHDIDKKFNEATNALDESSTFPSFEKVWDKIEKKLEQKENKKRIIPSWLPYGIAASLMIGIGTYYFLNRKETVKPVIVENIISHKTVPSLKIAKIDSTVKANVKKEILVPTPAKVLAHEKTFPSAGDIQGSLSYPFTDKSVTRVLDITTESIQGKWKDTLEKESRIEEVVMLGYGTKKMASSVTSSSISIASTDKSIVNMLSGRVAGLKISSSDNKDRRVAIRGISNFGKYTGPLIILDGYVSNVKALSTLAAKNVKDIKILKGDAAAALYGSKAFNGVIIIKTKRLSKEGKKKLKEISLEKEEFTKDLDSEKKVPKAGLLTAAEVNDFSKWNYWKDIAVPALDDYKKIWKFFPDKRVSIQLVNKDKNPVIGEKVKLLNDRKEVIWEAISDNLGNAELWIDPMGNQSLISDKYFLSDRTGQIINSNVKEFRSGQNLIILDRPCIEKRILDLAFVVDATGSMGDEISYLQSELLDVLRKVENNLKNTSVRYGSVFYRDKGDEYVTRKFDFSNRAEDMVNFIKEQKAEGGGDTPEAVVEAMQVSIDELRWSNENSTKIMFLILDAPPHQSDENINKLFGKIKEAAKKGITIIPLAASDTDKQTEYLMRTFALLTNGSYTFLTNDSGIGNNHIEPTTDSYEVEKLNDLLLRLILQRATLSQCNKGISNDFMNKKMEIEANDQVDSKIFIFPNPTKGVINIQFRSAIDELFVYDLAGKIIMRKERLPKGKNVIDITSYPQSIYLIRTRSQDKWETFKIIKN